MVLFWVGVNTPMRYQLWLLPIFGFSLANIEWEKSLLRNFRFTKTTIISSKRVLKTNRFAALESKSDNQTGIRQVKNVVTISLILTLTPAILSYSILVLDESHSASLVRQPQLRIGLNLVGPQVPAGEIYGENSVSQSFISPDDGLTEIQIPVATYARINNSSLQVSLLDSSRKVISTRMLLTKNILDNSLVNLDFSPLWNSKNMRYDLILKSLDGHSGNAITVWVTPNRIYPQGLLRIGKAVQPGAVLIKLLYKK